ncbi:Uncharacterised protein [Mycoplasmoides gallisepticum]|uniref:Uncharacterized protein n=1 Tax=Mycoplasmoides gallisepticum TaxID=2096 RepID=A0A3B0PDR1_MYCGL|nr:Uncharacterised protein [Mycoplasmoides gallisepticum]
MNDKELTEFKYSLENTLTESSFKVTCGVPGMSRIQYLSLLGKLPVANLVIFLFSSEPVHSG